MVGGMIASSGLGWTVKRYRHSFIAKRFFEVEPGAIYRGGWQQPWPLRRLIARYRFRSIVNLACRPDETDADGEGDIVRQFDLRWYKILMPGTGRGTYEQLDVAADAMADPLNRPVFVHCDGGRHRTNMALAAFRIKHGGWDIEAVVDELRRFGFDPQQHWRQLEHIQGYARRWPQHRPSVEREQFGEQVQFGERGCRCARDVGERGT